MQKTIYCDEYDNLLRWLKEKRLEGKLTMRQLAVRLDVHHSWVGRVELGERRLDVMEFVRYCNALEANPFEGLACLTDLNNYSAGSKTAQEKADSKNEL